MSVDEKTKLARAFSTTARKLVPLPGTQTVVEASPFTHELIFLKVKELRFLHALRPYFSDEKCTASWDEAIEAAAISSGLTVEWAKTFLNSKRYADWVGDRLDECAIREGVTVDYLIKKHKDNIEGRSKLKLSQLQSLSELGERIWPKTQRIEHQVEQKDSKGMDELLKARSEVEALETKLRAALTPELKVLEAGS